MMEGVVETPSRNHSSESDVGVGIGADVDIVNN